MTYQFKGRVAEICEPQTFSSGFSKRELVVAEEGEGKWTNRVTFNFKRDNAEKLKDVSVGEVVTVTFALDGREWTDPKTNKVRHFSDLVGLRVDPDPRVSDICASHVSHDMALAASKEDAEYPF